MAGHCSVEVPVGISKCTVDHTLPTSSLVFLILILGLVPEYGGLVSVARLCVFLEVIVWLYKADERGKLSLTYTAIIASTSGCYHGNHRQAGAHEVFHLSCLRTG